MPPSYSLNWGSSSGPEPHPRMVITPEYVSRVRIVNTDDLILVSIDDHVVEPPDMFVRHLPAKYVDEAPVVVADANGVDQWMYQGRPQGVSGLNAVVGWPNEEWGLDPAAIVRCAPASTTSTSGSGT